MNGRSFTILGLLMVGLVGQLSCKESPPDFLSGDCRSNANGIVSIRLASSHIERTSLAPYYCIAYKAGQDSNVTLDIINYSGNCAGPMGGTVHVKRPNQVVLRIKRQSNCDVSASCMCPYDMSLEVTDVATDEDLTVNIEHLECDGTRKGCYDVATLPLSQTSEGMACRYAGYAMGVLDGECDLSDADVEEPLVDCADAGICVNLDNQENSNMGRCMAECLMTEDCPRADIGLHECVEGYCRIANELARGCDE